MIRIKQILLGNSREAYVLSGFTDGLNIISSNENHVGKTIIMQAAMLPLVLNRYFQQVFTIQIIFILLI